MRAYANLVVKISGFKFSQMSAPAYDTSDRRVSIELWSVAA